MTSLGCACNFLIRVCQFLFQESMVSCFLLYHPVLLQSFWCHSSKPPTLFNLSGLLASKVCQFKHPKTSGKETNPLARPPLTPKLDCCIYMLCSFLSYLKNKLGIGCLLPIAVSHVSFCTISDSPMSLKAATGLTCFQWPLGTQTMLVSSALQVR